MVQDSFIYQAQPSPARNRSNVTYGKIFVFEGIECAGKSTSITQLKADLGNKVVFLTGAAERMKAIFPLGLDADESTEVAFLGCQATLVDSFDTLASKGANIIVERSWVSQIVYSAVRKSRKPSYAFDPQIFCTQEKVLRLLYPGVFRNTILVFFDVLPDESLRRAEHLIRGEPWRAKSDRDWVVLSHELYINYLKSINKDSYAGIERVDAMQHPNKVVTDLKAIIAKYAGVSVSF